jgi:hypothetical protein
MKWMLLLATGSALIGCSRRPAKIEADAAVSAYKSAIAVVDAEQSKADALSAEIGRCYRELEGLSGQRKADLPGGNPFYEQMTALRERIDKLEAERDAQLEVVQQATVKWQDSVRNATRLGVVVPGVE